MGFNIKNWVLKFSNPLVWKKEKQNKNEWVFKNEPCKLFLCKIADVFDVFCIVRNK